MSRKTKEQDVPGNSMASAALFAAQMVKKGEWMTRIESVLDKADERDVYVTSIRIRMSTVEHPGYLAVIKAWRDGAQCVAFHVDDTFEKALVGIINRLANHSLKWKDDEYGT